MIHDHVDKCYSLSQLFEWIITSREEWKIGSDTLPLSDIVWFTDGSKTKEGTGSEISTQYWTRERLLDTNGEAPYGVSSRDNCHLEMLPRESAAGL